MHRLGLLFLIAAAGCSKDEPIRVYDAPRSEESANPPKLYRILGAIVPTETGQNWYFKVSGAVVDLETHAAEIEAFFKTIKPANDPKAIPTWTLPAGWKPGAKTKMADAVIFIGSGDNQLRMTVTKSGGSIANNVRRWSMQQLGIPWTQSVLVESCKPLGEPAFGYTVDLAGPNMPPVAQDEEESGPPRIVGAVFPAGDQNWYFKVMDDEGRIEKHKGAIDAFLKSVTFPNGPQGDPKWDLPAGWKQGPPKQFASATFQFGNPGKECVISISKIGDSVENNLRRWASEQLQLPWPLPDRDKFIKPIGTVPGALIVDLTGAAKE